jgi:hypothetical protein
MGLPAPKNAGASSPHAAPTACIDTRAPAFPHSRVPAHHAATRALFETAPMEENLPPHSAPSAPLRNRPPSYLEQLREGKPAPPRAPYTELLRQRAVEQALRQAQEAARNSRFDLPDPSTGSGPPGKLDPALRDALAALLAYTLASGRDRISSRDIFRRLRVPSHLEQSEGRAIAQCLKSLGWVRVHWGKDAPGQRVWGWRWREWNISHVKVDLDT